MLDRAFTPVIPWRRAQTVELVTISPSYDELVITGHTPSVTTSPDIDIEVPKRSVVITTFRPFIQPSPSKDSLVITGYAPTVLFENIVNVPKGTLVITEYAPVAALTANLNPVVDVDVSNIVAVLSGTSPEGTLLSNEDYELTISPSVGEQSPSERFFP